MLALTPATQATNAGVVRMALDALATQPEARLIVKLHPGDGDWRYVRRLVQEHPVQAGSAWRIRNRLGPLLLEATVTWLHRSSVALESLAVGVPVVVTAQDEPSTADLELEGLHLPVAEAPSQLAQLSADVIGEPGRSELLHVTAGRSIRGTARRSCVVPSARSHRRNGRPRTIPALMAQVANRRARWLGSVGLEAGLAASGGATEQLSRLIVSVVAAGVLGPIVFGTWSLISVIVQYANVFSLGVAAGAARALPIALGAGDDEARSEGRANGPDGRRARESAGCGARNR